uniref:Sulfur globule protein CV3 n=1 Tax=Ascaris lumbricoides TaxID=6252 RepID=A0A9J2Q4C0_ASCLU
MSYFRFLFVVVIFSTNTIVPTNAQFYGGFGWPYLGYGGFGGYGYGGYGYGGYGYGCGYSTICCCTVLPLYGGFFGKR